MAVRGRIVAILRNRFKLLNSLESCDVRLKLENAAGEHTILKSGQLLTCGYFDRTAFRWLEWGTLVALKLQVTLCSGTYAALCSDFIGKSSILGEFTDRRVYLLLRALADVEA